MIYFIHAAEANRVKIGYTKNQESLKLRMAALQTGSPFPLYLIGAMNGDRRMERGLHDFFDKDRVSGEWFDLSPGLAGYILFKCGPGFCESHLNTYKNSEIEDLCSSIDRAINDLVSIERRRERIDLDIALHSVRKKINQALVHFNAENLNLRDIMELFDSNEKKAIRQKIPNFKSCIVKSDGNDGILFCQSSPTMGEVFDVFFQK